MKPNMFYGASNLIFDRATMLRARMTAAEEILWNVIHINSWNVKFRRQHPFSIYIVDFYCHAVKLVIELDGGYHQQEEIKRLDAVREKNIKDFGITILRFTNEKIFDDLTNVLTIINDIVNKLKSADKVESPNNSPSGASGSGVGDLVVIKIGGNILDDEAKLSSFLQAFAAIKTKKILVHGGGKIATKIGDQLGIESKYIDGRRITDADTIDLVTMVYAGLINKKIVAQLQALGCNAIGLTGADANMIPADKRPVKEIDYGFVGDVKENAFATVTCAGLLEENIAVVFAPITHDGKGALLNTNADTIAQETAKAMSKLYNVSLIFSFEKAGVLLDANDDATVINEINPTFYQQLKTEQKIFAGMIPKLDNAFAALNSGVGKVIIGKAEQLNELIEGTAGTTIINE